MDISTLGYDHRVSDGAVAAEFLSIVKKALENRDPKAVDRGAGRAGGAGRPGRNRWDDHACASSAPAWKHRDPTRLALPPLC